MLNVFADPAAASGMTDWDRAYLDALYGAELNLRNPNAQAGAVAAVMIRDREQDRDNDQIEAGPPEAN